MNEINIRFFNERSIIVIDLTLLFQVVFEKFPDCSLNFSKMNEEERLENSHAEAGLITAVDRLFRIFDGANEVEGLYEFVIKKGQK